MGVDPEDDCTFWFLGMYKPSGKGIGVGAVRFDSCPSYLFSDDFESGGDERLEQLRPVVRLEVGHRDATLRR